MSEKFLNTEEAATYLNMTKNSFYNLVYKGNVCPVNKNEKPYFFSKSELDNWSVKRNKINSMKKINRTHKLLSSYKIILLG
jgi:hypothetical protein